MRATVFGSKSLGIKAALVFSALLFTNPVKAYFSTMDTGELVAPGQYQVSFEPQIIFQNYSGFNAIGRFDTGINESSSVRGVLGVGTVDFEVGGFYKWVPFPDTETQPAIGGMVGVTIARVNSDTEYNIRFHPLVSKKLESEIGDVIPYGSIPIGITSLPDKTIVPIQLVAGAELRPLNTPNFSFFGEIGANINDAFGYISAMVTYRFDETALERGSR